MMWLRFPIRTQASVIAALLLAGGCISEKPSHKSLPQSDSSGHIEEINLLAVPVALNLDNRPGPDGFVIKIFAGSRKRPKPFPLEDGQIEILMFDGIPGMGDAVAQPRRIWTYSAQELKPYEVETSIGAGYQLAIPWGDAKPTHDKITVVARYTPRGGRPLTSAPSIIAAR
jgi:hypothetical protein